MTQDDTAETFRSGVAARLAGIPVETLRVWERRYGVVGPRLSARGQRLYSAAQVRRLGLIKQLLDQGHPIGSIAKLTTTALIAMQSTVSALGARPGEPVHAGAGKLRVVLAGPLLTTQRFEESFASAMPGIEVTIVARAGNASQAASALDGSTADLVIIELPTLLEDSAATVARLQAVCGARRILVLYRFAPSAVVRRLRAAGHIIARAPSDPLEMASLCQRLLHPSARTAGPVMAANSTDPAPPRFDERALAAFADASSTVYCECPRHLVDLLLDLVSFERYSAACASRSPADAALHRDLQQTAGRARSLLENALLRVAVAEGMSIPAAPGVHGA
jgi:hypothetical protein